MPQIYRTLNKDGSDNIDRSHLKRQLNDLYHQLLSVSWNRFFVFTLLVYLGVNLIFGGFYFLLGPEGLQGIDHKQGFLFFEECYFFSVQTFSTIGYGRVSPVGFIHNLLVSIEAFTGMLSIAVMSGLLFARFSRPTSKIKFSEVALVTQHRGQRCLVFRIANARLNQIVEATVSAGILMYSVNNDGEKLRIQYDLPMIRQRSLFFAVSWMVAHIIDEKSPLYGKSLEDLEKGEAEIIVSVMGFDDTFSQTIHARYSYLWNELIFDRQFDDMIARVDGRLSVDISKISTLKPLSD